MTTRFTALLIVAIAMANIGPAHATFDWQGVPSPALLAQAHAFLEQPDADKPTTLTQLLHAVDIRVTEHEVRQRVQVIWFYPNASDVQDYGFDYIYFDQQLDNVIVHQAVSLDRFGLLHPIDPATVRISQRDNDHIYTDTRQALIALPGLTRGGLSILDYERVTNLHLMETDWSRRVLPNYLAPVEQFRLTASWTPDFTFQWRNLNPDTTCEQARNLLNCHAEGLSANNYQATQHWSEWLNPILLGQTESWQAVQARAEQAFMTALTDVGYADSLLDTLAPDREDLDNAIAQVHEFVAQDIRYLSLSELGHAVTPHPIGTTLARRYGDCKDKSALLYYLLNKLGVAAYPVLVATERKHTRAMDIPAMGYFDHMIVCFPWHGQEHCLDATDAYTHWQHTPDWVQGKVALPLVGDAKLTNLPSSDHLWKLTVDTQLAFSANGDQIERQERTYHGEYAGRMRAYLNRMAANEREEWLQKNYQESVSNLTTPTVSLRDLEQLSPSLTVRTESHYSRLLTPGEALTYEELDAWLNSEINSVLMEETGQDSTFKGLLVNSTYTVNIPAQWQLTTPPPELSYVNDFGSLSRVTSVAPDGELTITTILDLPRQQVQADRIADFNQYLRLLTKESLIRLRGRWHTTR